MIKSANGSLPRERVAVKSPEQNKLSFAAQLFRSFEDAGGRVQRFAGETLPPASSYMSGWKQAFSIAALVMDWLDDPATHPSSELVTDIASPVLSLIDSLTKANSRGYMAGLQDKMEEVDESAE